MADGNGGAVDFKTRIAAARAKAEAAKGLLSDEDRAEQAARAEEAQLLDAARVAAREARDLAISRALDAMRVRYPQNVFDTLDLEDKSEGSGAYVLRNPPHVDITEWQARMSDTTDAKQRDRCNREFAMSSVVAWVETKADGSLVTHVIDDEKGSPAALHNLWTGRAGFAATSISGIATELGGFAAAKRKS